MIKARIRIKDFGFPDFFSTFKLLEQMTHRWRKPCQQSFRASKLFLKNSQFFRDSSLTTARVASLNAPKTTIIDNAFLQIHLFPHDMHAKQSASFKHTKMHENSHNEIANGNSRASECRKVDTIQCIGWF